MKMRCLSSMIFPVPSDRRIASFKYMPCLRVPRYPLLADGRHEYPVRVLRRALNPPLQEPEVALFQGFRLGQAVHPVNLAVRAADETPLRAARHRISVNLPEITPDAGIARVEQQFLQVQRVAPALARRIRIELLERVAELAADKEQFLLLFPLHRRVPDLPRCREGDAHHGDQDHRSASPGVHGSAEASSWEVRPAWSGISRSG